MDNCKYQLLVDGNIIRFDSEKELSDYILQNKLNTSTPIKLSADLSSRQEIVIKALNDSDQKTAYNKSVNLSETQFLKTEHIIDGQKMLLAPDFNEEKYIANKIAQNTEQWEKDNKNIEEESKKLSEETKRELSEDNTMKTFGLNAHVLGAESLKSGLYSKTVSDKINEFISNVEKANASKQSGFNYSDERRKVLVNKVRNEFGKFVNFVENMSNANLTKIHLVNNEATVKSSPDIIIVDEHGDPHIIDISISRKSFNEWDSAKILNSDYKLGIQRQLLESHVPTDRTSLYNNIFLLPVSSDIFDLDNFTFTDPVRRDIEPRLDYHSGEISKKLKKLIPTKFTNLHVRNSDIDNTTTQLLSALFPSNYTIRSKFAISDKNKVIDEIKSKKEEGKPYILYDHLENERIEIEKESDIETKVDDYFARYNAAKNSETYKLKKTILDAIKNPNKTITFTGKNSDILINRIFEKYLDGSWELVDNNIFTNQDLFVFKNNKYKVVEVVSLTANNLNTIYNFGIGNTLLGKYITNSEVNKDPKILPASTTNVEIIKALSVLNNTPELFDNFYLSDVKVLNYRDNSADSSNLKDLVHNFSQMYKFANKNNELKSLDNFKANKITLSDPFEKLYGEILFNIKALKNNKLIDNFSGNRPDLTADKLQ